MACKKTKKEGTVIPEIPGKKKCKPEEPMEKKKGKMEEVIAPKPSKDDMKKKMEELRKMRKK